MCRLLGFQASEPTGLDCALVHAPHSLMRQSIQDLEGFSHRHGWGIAWYENDHAHVERCAAPAHDGERFREAAHRANSTTVIAHVRRATIGEPSLNNTHPFRDGDWVLVHNGTVPYFLPHIRGMLLEAMGPKRQGMIEGATDSEHVFHYLRALQDADPGLSLIDALGRVARQVIDWCHDVEEPAAIALNLLVTDGRRMAGTRVGRSLHFVHRDDLRDGELCGLDGIPAACPYQAAVIASEPLTAEKWVEIPNLTAWEITPDLRVRWQPLFPLQ